MSESGFVRLTPELLTDIADSLKRRRDEIEARYPTLVEDCPYEERLAVTAWVFKAIVDHAMEGGSFRHLNQQGSSPGFAGEAAEV